MCIFYNAFFLPFPPFSKKSPPPIRRFTLPQRQFPESIENFTILCYNQFYIFEFNGGKGALYNEIKSSEDIKYFLEKTNMLHDGYIIDAQYKYYGIEKTEDGLCFCPEEKS